MMCAVFCCGPVCGCVVTHRLNGRDACVSSLPDSFIAKSSSLPGYGRNGLHRVSSLRVGGVTNEGGGGLNMGPVDPNQLKTNNLWLWPDVGFG